MARRLHARFMAVALVVVAACLPLVLATAEARPVVLTGTVGPGASIKLTKGGKVVTSIPAGTYTLKVVDNSSHHNFHLTGRGVNVKTTEAFRGTRSFPVTFRKGKAYRYQCDPHADEMFGSVRAT